MTSNTRHTPYTIHQTNPFIKLCSAQLKIRLYLLLWGGRVGLAESRINPFFDAGSWIDCLHFFYKKAESPGRPTNFLNFSEFYRSKNFLMSFLFSSKLTKNRRKWPKIAKNRYEMARKTGGGNNFLRNGM